MAYKKLFKVGRVIKNPKRLIELAEINGLVFIKHGYTNSGRHKSVRWIVNMNFGQVMHWLKSECIYEYEKINKGVNNARAN